MLLQLSPILCAFHTMVSWIALKMIGPRAVGVWRVLGLKAEMVRCGLKERGLFDSEVLSISWRGIVGFVVTCSR